MKEEIERPIPAWERALDRVVLSLGRTPWSTSGNVEARGLLRVFPPVQRRLEKGHDIRLLRPEGYVRYEVAPFPAAPIRLASGERISRGDQVVIIHFENRVLSRMRMDLPSRRAFTWWMWRAGEEDFRRLAALMREGEIPAEARAVWGETIIYTALARMGYHTQPSPPGLRTPFARLYSLALMAVYGSLDLTMQRLEEHPLGEAWLSREELAARFG